MSAPIGSGHIRAAQAVEAAIRSIAPQIDTRLANVFEFLPPTVGKTILNTYLKILHVYPKAYGMAYAWGNRSPSALLGRQLINGYLAGRMLTYIEQYKPSLIVCTHATPAGLMAHLLRQEKVNVPTVAIVTDYIVHRLWIYPEITRYYVAHEQLRTFLAEYGVFPANSQTSGIPIALDFQHKINKRQLIGTLGMNEHIPIILIMGGGAGTIPMDTIVRSFEALEMPLQFIAVAGNNKKMYNQLVALGKTCSIPLKIYGFTNNIHELMQISDLLISKPGGVTAAEAVAAGLPIIIYRPIPGQEEANTDYLIQSGAALRADTLRDVFNLTTQLLTVNHCKLSDLKRKAVSLGRPNAANQIAAGLIDMLAGD
jgi:processive 1,2-diacylglycerol beta-glucosyltransferase